MCCYTYATIYDKKEIIFPNQKLQTRKFHVTLLVFFDVVRVRHVFFSFYFGRVCTVHVRCWFVLTQFVIFFFWENTFSGVFNLYYWCYSITRRYFYHFIF